MFVRERTLDEVLEGSERTDMLRPLTLIMVNMSVWIKSTRGAQTSKPLGLRRNEIELDKRDHRADIKA